MPPECPAEARLGESLWYKSGELIGANAEKLRLTLFNSCLAGLVSQSRSFWSESPGRQPQ